MWAHIRDACSTQCNIYGSLYSLGTHCTITQTTAADKITGQSVLALGNSRNTSRSLFASYCFSISLSLSFSLANSRMTSSVFLSFLLYSSELGPSEWISETSWQAKQQKIEIKSLLSFSESFFVVQSTERSRLTISLLWANLILENSDNFLTSNCQLWDFQHLCLQGLLQRWFAFRTDSTKKKKKRLNYTFKCNFIL